MEATKHPGGRPPKPTAEKAIGKPVYLTPQEWAELARRDPDGRPTRELCRIVRKALALTTNT